MDIETETETIANPGFDCFILNYVKFHDKNGRILLKTT